MENNSLKTITMDARLRRNELGFWELLNKPTKEELADYYANKYYQNESANYRKKYSELEMAVINLRVSQRVRQISLLRGGGQNGVIAGRWMRRRFCSGSFFQTRLESRRY